MRPERTRTPMYAGEGLDRESGLLVVRPVDFRDLRNVLLHEGQMQLRPGFLPKGQGQFEEVDRLIAGFPLKSDGLGIVVGYNATTEKVYVYRVAPDVSIVELLGEWIHDLASGWGSTTPRIIMCEVFGRVFMAHDESRVTRRAPTLYYDPITGEQLLNYLTATFAGTSFESGESGAPESESVVVVPNAIRFRGVVRHLQYLVGWGFGTSTEVRPELVRISLPGDPLTFDVNHYFIAGDRRDPVLACGATGDVDGVAAVLAVWKRSETHAITGTDRASFGIKLIDPRHGIVASRAWVNVEGFAVAWAEEGPRIWQGLSPSEALELPLGLEAWEPEDLVAEGSVANAFAHYVPRERVAWFHFGRRVYALTARVKGRWRWSYQTLGFDSYGAVTLFDTTEEKVAPEGFPTCDDVVAAGTYADITVGNHNQGGDETIEVWLRPYTGVSGDSGDVTEPSPGVFVGATDMSEYSAFIEAAGSPYAGWPAGLVRDSGSSTVLEEIISDDDGPKTVARRNVTSDHGHRLEITAFSNVFKYGEILARLYFPSVSHAGTIGRYILGPAKDATGVDEIDGVEIWSQSNTLRMAAVQYVNGAQVVSGATINLGDPGAGNPFWAWVRLRMEPTGVGTTRYRCHITVSAYAAPPAVPGIWQLDQIIAATQFGPVGNKIGWSVKALGTAQAKDVRLSYFGFTTDPASSPTPDTVSDLTVLEPGEWYLAKSVAVTTGQQQVVRVDGLDSLATYDVALRYRRGLLYNAGAENSDDPTTWPSVSRCSFETTVDPPEIEAAVWSRFGAGANERVTLTIDPVVGEETTPIEVYWKLSGLGAFDSIDDEDPPTQAEMTLIDTIAGPHAHPFNYQNDGDTGEKYYWYAVATQGGPIGPPVAVWQGPKEIPRPLYAVFDGANMPILGFEHDGLGTDTFDYFDTLIAGDPPGVGGFANVGSAAAGATEAHRTSNPGLDSNDNVTFEAIVRINRVTLGVSDRGPFSVRTTFVWSG